MKVKDGSIQEQVQKYILGMALGNPEQSGRVRGVGGMVTPTTYFNLPKRTKPSELLQHLLEEQKKLNQQQREDAEERKSLLDQLRQLYEENIKLREIPKIAASAQYVSDKGSCCSVKKLHPNKTIAASDIQNDANIELVSIGQKKHAKGMLIFTYICSILFNS